MGGRTPDSPAAAVPGPDELAPDVETDPAAVAATGDPEQLTRTMLRLVTGIGPTGASSAAAAAAANTGPGAGLDVEEGPLVGLAAVAGQLDELAAIVEGELRREKTALAMLQARTAGAGSGELQELLEAQHGRRRTVGRLLARALAEAHGDLDEIGDRVTQIIDAATCPAPEQDPDLAASPTRVWTPPAPRPAPVRGRATVGAAPDAGVWSRPVAELVPAEWDPVAVGAVLVAGTHDLGVAAETAWPLWSQRMPGRRLPAPVPGWCRRFRADPADHDTPVEHTGPAVWAAAPAGGAGAGHVWWPAQPGVPGAVACVEFVLPTTPPRPDDLSPAGTTGSDTAGGDR